MRSRRAILPVMEVCEGRRLLSAGVADSVRDASGNRVDVGSFTGTVDFDPRRGASFELRSAGGRDIFVAKYDRRGRLIWAVRAGAAQADEASAVGVDARGDVLIGGTFTERVDFDPSPTKSFHHHAYSHLPDVFVWKLTAGGRFAWAAHGGGSTNERLDGLAVDAAGNAYVGGIGDAGGRFGKATVARDASGYVVKVDAATGAFLRTWQFGGGNGARVTAVPGVDVDAGGNVFAAGRFRGVVDFDATGGVRTLSSGGSGVTRSFVTRQNANGGFGWAHRIGGGTPAEVVARPTGSVFVRDRGGDVLAKVSGRGRLLGVSAGGGR